MTITRFILIVILIGLLTSLYSQPCKDGRSNKKPNPEQRAERITQALNEKLSLSPEQFERIRAINLEAAKKIGEVLKTLPEGDRKARHHALKPIRQHTQNQIRSVLTPNQLTKLEQFHKERKQKRKECQQHHKKMQATTALNLYPNPATTNATVETELPKPADIELIILNHNGNKVQTFSYPNQNAGKVSIPINTNNLQPDTYTIMLVAKSKEGKPKRFVRTTKLIVGQ